MNEKLYEVRNFMKRNKLSNKNGEVIISVRKVNTYNLFIIYDFNNLINEV